MTLRIAILIRHGDYQQLADTPSAHQLFPLTARGREEAAAAAHAVDEMLTAKGWRLDPTVHCSTLRRAWQTAEILIDQWREEGREEGREERRAAGREGLRLVDTDRLAERSVGAAANLSIPQISAIVDDDPRFPPLPAGWKSDSRFRLPFPGAESLIEAGHRVAAYLGETLDQPGPTADIPVATLFVGHGAAFRHAALALGVLTEDQVAAFSMFHARPVALARDSAGRWHHAGGDWKMRHADDRPD